MDPRPSRQAALLASLALLFFAGLTTFALLMWFRAAGHWNWKSGLAAGAAVLAVTTSAFVWRAPTRKQTIFGIAVMLGSLARVGPPSDWTWVSFALVAVTFVLLMPLVHAAIVLRTD